MSRHPGVPQQPDFERPLEALSRKMPERVSPCVPLMDAEAKQAILGRPVTGPADCGADALQPIEPKAMDIGEVKRRFGDRFAFIGNVEVDLLSRGTP